MRGDQVRGDLRSRVGRWTPPPFPSSSVLLCSLSGFFGQTGATTKTTERAGCAHRACCGGRYWVRTSDLFRVREARYRCANRPICSCCVASEVATGFEPVLTALQAAASPLGHATVWGVTPDPYRIRADDEIRTRDPHLGKVMRYQLRHIRTAR